MSTLLAALRAPVLSTDLPTGATPKKRIWPDATAPDSLDSLSREALLAQLRGSMAPAPTTTHHPLNVSIPAPTKLEIPLGVATGKAGQAVRRSVLGEKAPNTALVAPVTVATMRR